MGVIHQTYTDRYGPRFHKNGKGRFWRPFYPSLYPGAAGKAGSEPAELFLASQ